jgi:hypothetical protein
MIDGAVSINETDMNGLGTETYAFSFLASEESSSLLSPRADPAAERRSPTPALLFLASCLLASLLAVAPAPVMDSCTYVAALETVVAMDCDV